MNIEDIVYSVKPMTIRELILSKKGGEGDWEAMAEYIMLRTNMPIDEILEIDLEDAAIVLHKITENANQAALLQDISKDLNV